MSAYKDLKILIVDDLQENLISLSAILTREGFKVEATNSAREALNMLLKDEYGLALLDVHMPDIDGFEMAEYMRKSSRTRNIPVVFLSASATNKEFFLAGLSAGAVDYITKPFDPAVLLLKVSNLLSLSYAQRELKKATENLSVLNKQLERKAASSQLSYEELFYNSPDEIVIIDSNGRIVKSNTGLSIFCGSSTQDDLIGKYFTETPLFTNLTSVYAEKELMTLLFSDTRMAPPLEIEVRPAGGNVFYGSINFSRIKSENGEDHVQLIIRNITARRKAEQKLIESEKKYRILFEQNPQPMWLYNVQTLNFADVNEAAIQKYGYTKSEFLSMTLMDIRPAEDISILMQKTSALRGINKSGIVRHRTKPGKILFVEITSDAVLFGGQELRLVVATDVTEKKKAEDDLAASFTKLQLSEAEKTRLLKELTMKYNELMQFNYIVSHNLRAPIANIIGLSNILNMSSVSGEEKEQILPRIKECAEKMDEIFRDLNLILSAKSDIASVKEEISLRPLTESIVASIKNQNANVAVAIDINVDDGLTVYSVKTYVESVIYNLISNGVKFRSDDRPARVRISAKANDDSVVIAVEDNGVGIDLKQHGEYIFGLYKRFNLEREGKGIGLHMTKAQVESLGGEIVLESEPGKGTAVRVILPVSGSLKQS